MASIGFPPPPPSPGFRPPFGPPAGPPGGPPPPGAPGSERRMAADATFGAGAGDTFKQGFDTLATGGDSRFANAAGKLEKALQSGDLSSLKDAAQALEGLVKDKVANPAQAGGLAGTIAALKAKIGTLSAAAGQTDSFQASTSSTASTGTAASSTAAQTSTSSTAASSASKLDTFFGPGGADTFNAAKALLGSHPLYGNAGMALSYVMDTVASKGQGNLSSSDYGAIQQAIIQMQSLVKNKAVNPAQAGQLNNAIFQLQGALTR